MCSPISFIDKLTNILSHMSIERPHQYIMTDQAPLHTKNSIN